MEILEIIEDVDITVYSPSLEDIIRWADSDYSI